MEQVLARGLSIASLVLTKVGACTLCDTDQAQGARAGIFDAEFTATLIETTLPLLVAAGLAVLAYAVAPEHRAVIRNPYGAGDDIA